MDNLTSIYFDCCSAIYNYPFILPVTCGFVFIRTDAVWISGHSCARHKSNKNILIWAGLTLQSLWVRLHIMQRFDERFLPKHCHIFTGEDTEKLMNVNTVMEQCSIRANRTCLGFTHRTRVDCNATGETKITCLLFHTVKKMFKKIKQQQQQQPIHNDSSPSLRFATNRSAESSRRSMAEHLGSLIITVKSKQLWAAASFIPAKLRHLVLWGTCIILQYSNIVFIPQLPLSLFGQHYLLYRLNFFISLSAHKIYDALLSVMMRWKVGKYISIQILECLYCEYLSDSHVSDSLYDKAWL